uniref:uncharacterized protein n=1 Tax=Pristiophorus japonicus TaxID=55135 RepID=UPI00398EE711
MQRTVGILKKFSEGDDWETFVERRDQHSVTNELDGEESTAKRRAILLTVCGAPTCGIMKNLLTPAKPTEKSYDHLCILVREHLNPKESILMVRYRFYTYKRERRPRDRDLERAQQEQKKLSTMRSMQRRTGGGPPVPSDITDKEERVLALVGKHPRTATDASADPEVMPPQPATRPKTRPQRPEGGDAGQELADDPTTSGAEQLRFSPGNPLSLSSTDESVDFKEPASPRSRSHSTPRPSSGPPVIPAPTLEVPTPSTCHRAPHLSSGRRRPRGGLMDTAGLVHERHTTAEL